MRRHLDNVYSSPFKFRLRVYKQRNIILQGLLLATLFAVGCYFYENTTQNLRHRGIVSGFGFLRDQTGFDIIMHLISYSPTSSYLRAFVVGILNTLLLSGLAIIFSTALGAIVGVARLSSNWLVAKLAMCYVELFRNIPLLLQIFFWYYVLLHYLPPPEASIKLLRGVTLDIRGLNFVNHGLTVIPEMTAMLLALSLYTASYISENIRAGILSVDKGQKEAAIAFGLKPHLILRLIIMPQALRVIILPLASQYLNVTKNSSLASAIGYPDLMAVFAGTVLNQTGQALVTIFMTMSVYLVISLSISMLMNWYNHRMALVEK